MKKSDFAGWREVFAFSFEQGIKVKSFVIFVVVMFLIMLLYTPVTTLLSGDTKDSDTAYQSTIDHITVIDLTGLPIQYEDFLSLDGYQTVKLTTIQEDTFEAAMEGMKESEANDICVRIAFQPAEAVFDITMVKTAKGSYSEEELNQFTSDFLTFFNEMKLNVTEVTPEQLAFVNQPVEMKTSQITSDGHVEALEVEEGIGLDQYNLLLAGIVVVTLLISFSGNSIANAIVTEKSTRVIEYLMINVRPMALLLGKILASLLLTVIQFGAIGLGYLGSGILTKAIAGTQQESSSFLDALSAFSGVNLTVACLVIIIGVLCFCFLAGLAGASASKMDELQEALKLYSVAMIVGSYIAIAICITRMTGGASNLLTVAALLPISAPFVVPMNLLTGDISLSLALISMAILIASAAALFVLSARVYEAMIFHTGKVLKLKDIIGLAKAKRAMTETKKEGE